jgi:diguanylate cyclase (GGDEF)-like protein
MDRVAAKLGRWITGSGTRPRKEENVKAEAEHFLGSAVEPVDRGTFNRLRDALGDSLRDAISPFLEDMPRYLDEIAQAAANGDGEALRSAAHAVKGSAGNLGAMLLANAAKEVEDLAESGRLAEATEAVDRLPAEYALVHQALLTEMRLGGGGSEEDVAPGEPLVLVVDDDRSTRNALRHALQRGGFRVEEAGDGIQALALLEHLRPDVILMDAMMPELDGFATCAKLQEIPQTREIPVLMITALEDNRSIERAFMAGASDYIPKPINFSVVQQRVRRLVDANRTERYVRHLSYSDAVTGLPNRVMFSEQLSRMLDRSGAAQSPVAVLFLDLDRFKFVNDSLGHEVGDLLLKTVAERIRECVRTTDCVARLGGDEFSVALTELPSPGVAAVTAQKICRMLAEPFIINDHEIFVTVSIGISIYPEDGLDVSTLLRHADTALYRAKKNSSGFQFYESGMEASMSAHLRLENSLRRALEREELEIFYQPIATSDGMMLTGAEALLRWRHPGRGLISPAEFIPIAEETGLILPVGGWVLRGACLQITRWLAAYGTSLRVAVNLSGKQLQQPRFVETVREIIAETKVPPEYLTLEITESVVMEHARETIATLDQLKKLGVSLAIDDFGTGYSSLSYLKRFPVDILKIDRSFTRDVPRDADDSAIVTGIIALAHSLRLQVVAEGVETEEQHQFLTKLGCDYIQGFLLSQPVPIGEFENRYGGQIAGLVKVK